MGEQAGTGFLVAAAVLLPGQIGKDEASKRAARQDSLDEIIIGTQQRLSTREAAVWALLAPESKLKLSFWVRGLVCLDF